MTSSSQLFSAGLDPSSGLPTEGSCVAESSTLTASVTGSTCACLKDREYLVKFSPLCLRSAFEFFAWFRDSRFIFLSPVMNSLVKVVR